ncbi:MAG: hypothetical protein ACTSYO_06235 [Candidatus Ranarchaeia archaeon]
MNIIRHIIVNFPLKVFGGRHRIKAIIEACKKNISYYHGVRVYFALNNEQRLDIAVANNTAIAIPNDLLDRMFEDSPGTNLRERAKKCDILEKTRILLINEILKIFLQ